MAEMTSPELDCPMLARPLCPEHTYLAGEQ